MEILRLWTAHYEFVQLLYKHVIPVFKTTASFYIDQTAVLNTSQNIQVAAVTMATLSFPRVLNK